MVLAACFLMIAGCATHPPRYKAYRLEVGDRSAAPVEELPKAKMLREGASVLVTPRSASATDADKALTAGDYSTRKNT